MFDPICARHLSSDAETRPENNNSDIRIEKRMIDTHEVKMIFIPISQTTNI